MPIILRDYYAAMDYICDSHLFSEIAFYFRNKEHVLVTVA